MVASLPSSSPYAPSPHCCVAFLTGFIGPEGNGGVPPLTMPAQVTFVEWVNDESPTSFMVIVVVAFLLALVNGGLLVFVLSSTWQVVLDTFWGFSPKGILLGGCNLALSVSFSSPNYK